MSKSNKTIVFISSLVIGIAFSMPVLAEDEDTSYPNLRERLQQFDADDDGRLNREERQLARQAIGNNRQNIRDRREDVRDRREDVADRREDVRDRREDIADRREDIRDSRRDVVRNR